MRNLILNTTAVAFGGLLFAVSGMAGAAIITVTTVADELDIEAPNGLCSLREAVEAVNFSESQDCINGDGNDTITFDASLTGQTIILDRVGASEDDNQTGDLDLLLRSDDASITITGPGNDAGSIIIDGNGSDRVFHLIGDGVERVALIEFSGLTIQNGRAQQLQQGSLQAGGGGILADFSTQEVPLILTTLRLQNLQVTQNAVIGDFQSGGGAYFSGAETTIVNNAEFLNNSVSSGFGASGGGLYVQQPGDMTVTGSVFMNNSLNAESGEVAGGGLFIMPNTSLTISDSRFSSNEVNAIPSEGFGSSLSAMGGGLAAMGPSSLSITDSFFESNTVQAGGGFADGGGLYVPFSDSATITGTQAGLNSVVAEDGDARGGGIYLGSARTASFDDVNLAENSLTTVVGAFEAGGNAQGGGLWVLNVDETLSIANSVFTQNTNSASGDFGQSGEPNGPGQDFNTFIGPGGFGGPGKAVGAGFYLSAASALTITDSDFTGNMNSGSVNAEGGGAFVEVVANDINISGSLFFDNDVAGPNALGGGLSVLGNIEETVNNLNISTSIFSSNRLTASVSGAIGGGLLVENTEAIAITTSEFAENSVTTQGESNSEQASPQALGGGIAIQGPFCPGNVACIQIRNSTLSGNNLTAQNASAIGAGLFLTTDSGSDSIALLNNLTITNNQVLALNDEVSLGGGIAVADDAVIQASNNIVADNSAGSGPDCIAASTGEDDPPLFGTFVSNGFNLIGDGSACPFPAQASDSVGSVEGSIDPVLGLLADNGGETRTHQLLAGSPAIDGGNPVTPTGADGSCESIDQRGETRPNNGDGSGAAECDIGALERVANAPPSIVNAIADRTLQSNDADVVIDLTTVFSDAEESELTFAAVSSNATSVVASVDGNILTISPVANGVATVDVTATDDLGAQATDSPVITVTNQAPVIDNAIPDQGLSANGSQQSFDLDSVFSDPENDPLTFTASSSNTQAVTASIDGNVLMITPGGAGDAMVSVTATDDLEAATTDTFNVNVAVDNLPPNIVSPIPDQSRRAGSQAVIFDLTTVFADPDEDTLNFDVTSSDPQIVSAELQGSTLTLTPITVGNVSIDVTAFDSSEDSVTDTLVFEVTNANRTPSIVSEIPDQSIPAEGNASIDLTQIFEDPDGDPLFFTATSSNPDVVAVDIDENGVLTLTAGVPGTATITVTAQDTFGAQTFSRVNIGGSSNAGSSSSGGGGGGCVMTDSGSRGFDPMLALLLLLSLAGAVRAHRRRSRAVARGGIGRLRA